MRITCNFPRIQALRIGFVLLAAFLSVSLSAQTARIHSSGPQANLRIEVKVVPAVAVHHHDKDGDKDKEKDGDREDGAVSYNLNPQHEEFCVTEKIRLMLMGSGDHITGQEQVRTITVVQK